MIKLNFTEFENQATIGEGIYTIPDLAQILKQPIDKVRRWVDSFFDDKFANEFKANYSWKVDKSKAVNFHTMIELVSMFNLSKQGLSTREIVKGHNSLVKMYHTPHPYADKKVMEELKINGKKLIANLDGSYVNTDGSNQLNFHFISQLLESIDFDDNLAVRYYPMGKEKSIVIDPKRKFGSAVVGDTNIYPETLYSYYKGGESIKYIAALFEIDEQMVKDAISFCKQAA